VKQFTAEYRDRTKDGATRPWEASVPSSGDHNPDHRGIDWPAIVRTLLLEVLVLLALSAAVMGYLDWSSETAWVEFMAASKSSAAESSDRPPSSVPIRTVKGQKPCPPKT
jgi:hypothetical protein